MEYWQKGDPADNRILLSQLRRWEKFRFRQRRNRERYVRRDWFPKFLDSLRERRRKYGLDGDVQLCEKVADQSELQDWTEYQNYELQDYERSEEGLKESQENLGSKRKALAEEGFSAFEEIEGLEWGKYIAMNQDWGDKMEEVKEKRKLAERKLSIATTRLEAAQSKGLGEMVEQHYWISWLASEVESRRSRMEELKRSADETKQDVKPYEQWLEAKEDECRATDSERFWSEEVQRLFEIEARTVEYRTKARKRDELYKKALEVDHAHCCAEIELEIAEEGLEAARREDLAPTVQKAALIRRTQKEVRSAEFHLEEEKESEKVFRLKLGVVIALYEIPRWREEIKRHKLLLDWIEQQRQELLEEQRRKLVSDGVNSGQERGPRRSTRINSRTANPSPRTTQAPPIDHPAAKRTRQQRTRQQRLMVKSILDPVHPAKVTKAPKQKWKGRSRTSVSHDISQLMEQANVDSNPTESHTAESHTAESQSEGATIPVEDRIRARLLPIHSSRVSKSTSQKPITLRKEKEVVDRSMNTRTKGNTQVSKQSQSRHLNSR